MDYVYGVLYSPQYRRIFHDYLKDDFPRIPVPHDDEEFEALANFGGQLRKLHTGVVLPSITTSFPESGSNKVGKAKLVGTKMYINDSQYIESVPQEAWDFYVGGYSVLQKWLKERRGMVLGFDDLFNLQKIVSVLKESRILMNEVEKRPFSWNK